MKNIFVIIVLFFNSIAYAGVEFGNGGGVVVCRRPILKTIKSVELLDFYEARSLRGLKIDLGDKSKPWKEQVQFVLNRLRSHSDLRYQIYGRWLENFEKEALFVKDANFTTIEDTAHVAIPKGCGFEQAAVQRKPEFPNDPRYYVSEYLWNHMNDTQKAGLVLHELTYREAIGYGHALSTSTRYFVAKIASNDIEKMSNADFFELIKEVKFEQTDLPLPGKTGSMSIRLKRFWNPSKYETDPGILKLDRRVVVQVGQCQGQGCEDFVTDSFENNLQCLENQSEQCAALTQYKRIQASLSRDVLAVEYGDISFALKDFVSEQEYRFDPNQFKHCEKDEPFIRHDLEFVKRSEEQDYILFDSKNYVVSSMHNQVPTDRCEVMRLIHYKDEKFSVAHASMSYLYFTEFVNYSIPRGTVKFTATEGILDWGGDETSKNIIDFSSSLSTDDLESIGSGCSLDLTLQNGRLRQVVKEYPYRDDLTPFKQKLQCYLRYNSFQIKLKNELKPGDPEGLNEDMIQLLLDFTEEGNLDKPGQQGFSEFTSTRRSEFFPWFEVRCEDQYTACIVANPTQDGQLSLDFSKTVKITLQVWFTGSSSGSIGSFEMKVASPFVELRKLKSGYIFKSVDLAESATLPISKTETQLISAGSVITFDDNGYVIKSEKAE